LGQQNFVAITSITVSIALLLSPFTGIH